MIFSCICGSSVANRPDPMSIEYQKQIAVLLLQNLDLKEALEDLLKGEKHEYLTMHALKSKAKQALKPWEIT